MKKIIRFERIVCFTLAIALQASMFNSASAKINGEFFKKYAGEIVLSIVGACSVSATVALLCYNRQPDKDKNSDSNFANQKSPEVENLENVISKLEKEKEEWRNRSIRRDIIDILEENKKFKVEFSETRKKRHAELTERLLKKINGGASEEDLKDFIMNKGLTDKCVNAILRYYNAISSPAYID